MARNGKIARLPKETREELNRRLEDGEPGVRLVEWLNGLPEVQRVLAAEFGGRAINEPNLTEWKQGGFLEWQTEREIRWSVEHLVGVTTGLSAALSDPPTVAGGKPGAVKKGVAGVGMAKAGGPRLLGDMLALALAGRYAVLLSGWNGEWDETFQARVKGLQRVCRDVVRLRRGDHNGERLKLDRERFEAANHKKLHQAMEWVIAESKGFPDVQQAFRKALALVEKQMPDE